jgi:tropinone reductase I
MERWRLDNKIALVTGGSKGIGKAIVEEFLQLGAAVVAVARNAETLRESVQPWIEEKKPVVAVPADVADEGDRLKVLETVRKQFGKLDVLVSNVGTNIRKPIADYSLEEIEFLIRTNFISSLEIVRAAFSLLKPSGNSSVIFMGSIAGLNTVRTGIPYGATKAALTQVTRGLAVEWAKHAIRVNLIAPGFIETPLTEYLLRNEELMSYVNSRIPMQRPGVPQEVATLATFLAMPASSYITGQVFIADGGVSANLL